MTAFYSEIDPYCAQWLRNLIDAGHIAPGVVDERSIEDITPNELREYTQCHFFAGVGVWSYALRLAGWPDDRPVWTGSCPCQPFSAAGKGHGFADERHLWPAWFHLIRECRPATVFGEQVASKAVDAWIDLVHADMEGMGYAFGSVPFPSAGVGAPHIRDRLYWVADTSDKRQHGRRASQTSNGRDAAWVEPERLCDAGGLADTVHAERWSLGIRGQDGCDWADGGRQKTHGIAGTCSQVRGERPGPTNGFWRAADWLLCTDGKWRPVEPGTFPLAHGITNRVGRLRAYGNAINAEVAATFIRSYLEVEKEVQCAA